MRIFKRITALALAAVTAGTMGLGVAAVENHDDECTGITDICDTSVWGIEDYANNIKEIYKMDFPESSDVIDEIVDGFLQDGSFINDFELYGGSAFLRVEESLRDVLDPEAMPAYEYDGYYYTNYNIPRIMQKPGYNDGAAAAVLMALYGCGKYPYSGSNQTNDDARQNAIIDQIYWTTNNKTTISEITRVLRCYFTGSKLFDYQTKRYYDFSKAMTIMAVSLTLNVVPIVRISDGSSYYYGVIEAVDYNEDFVKVIDPRTASTHTFTFDSFKSKAASNGIIWMSVYASDESEEAIEQVKSDYPSGKTYFTNNKGVCTNHNDFDHPELLTCKKWDGAWQCAGFARYVFEAVKGRTYTSSIAVANVTGFGNRTNVVRLDDNDSFTGEELISAQIAKKYLQGLPIGTYVRVRNRNDNSDYPWHSFAVLATSDNDIEIYQANVGGNCLITTKTYTWDKFVKIYSHILFYVD